MGFFCGKNKTGPYFEGWYFKHQNPQGQTPALIPAFHIGGEGRRTASLQVISRGQTWWLEYPEAQPQVSRHPPVIPSRASQHRGQRLRAAGCGRNDNAGIPLKPIHLGEELAQSLLPLVAASHFPRVPLLADGIDLIQRNILYITGERLSTAVFPLRSCSMPHRKAAPHL